MKIFSVPMTVHATAYVRAINAENALIIAATMANEGLDLDGDSDLISGLKYDDPRLPNVSISPAMTIGGPEEHIENVECVHNDETGDEPAAAPLSAAEALERIRARLAGKWSDPYGDLESDIKATLSRVKAYESPAPETLDDVAASAYERAAAAHGWDHGGDKVGVWYNAKLYPSWKAAVKSGECATYATAKEVCEGEGLFVSSL